MDATPTNQLFRVYDLAFNLLSEYVVADLTMSRNFSDHILTGAFNLTDWIKKITFVHQIVSKCDDLSTNQ